jgi:hypothetical protein
MSTMASRHATKKATLRGRQFTRTRDIARTLKYDVPDVDFARLERELCTPTQQRRTFGGAR